METEVSLLFKGMRLWYIFLFYDLFPFKLGETLMEVTDTLTSKKFLRVMLLS